MIGKVLSIGSEAATGSFISQPSLHHSVYKRLEIQGGGAGCRGRGFMTFYVSLCCLSHSLMSNSAATQQTHFTEQNKMSAFIRANTVLLGRPGSAKRFSIHNHNICV